MAENKNKQMREREREREREIYGENWNEMYFHNLINTTIKIVYIV